MKYITLVPYFPNYNYKIIKKCVKKFQKKFGKKIIIEIYDSVKSKNLYTINVGKTFGKEMDDLKITLVFYLKISFNDKPVDFMILYKNKYNKIIGYTSNIILSIEYLKERFFEQGIDPKTIIYLMDIEIDDEYQGKGLSYPLLCATARESLKYGYKYMILLNAVDDDYINYYEKMGFEYIPYKEFMMINSLTNILTKDRCYKINK